MSYSINEVKVGMPAPDFTLDDQKLQPWQLSANRGKVVALIFYPKDETMVCTRQFCSLKSKWDDYVETGATIIGISPDTSSSHVRFATKHKLPLPLLSDPGRKIARQYISHWLYPLSFVRGLVVIDSEGIVRHREIILRVFRPLDSDVIRAIRGAQFARPDVEVPGLSDKVA
jgi:peroxiredoxin Q/BCP